MKEPDHSAGVLSLLYDVLRSSLTFLDVSEEVLLVAGTGLTCVLLTSAFTSPLDSLILMPWPLGTRDPAPDLSCSPDNRPSSNLPSRPRGT